MMRRMTVPLDMAFGSVLALAGAAFGVVGFIAGLMSNGHATQWFLAAAILGVLSGAVLLDEARTSAVRSGPGLDAWVGTVLGVFALAAGTVGFILGLTNNAHPMIWLVSGAVLAVLSLGATMDEVRRWHGHRLTAAAMLSSLGILFGALGLGLVIVGFIVGLMSKQYADTWLWAAVVSSIVALGWTFEAEHRAMAAEISAGRAEIRPLGGNQAMQS